VLPVAARRTWFDFFYGRARFRGNGDRRQWRRAGWRIAMLGVRVSFRAPVLGTLVLRRHGVVFVLDGREGIARRDRFGGEADLLAGKAAGCDRDRGRDHYAEQRQSGPAQRRRHPHAISSPRALSGLTVLTVDGEP
jgi:hypothetical protein